MAVDTDVRLAPLRMPDDIYDEALGVINAVLNEIGVGDPASTSSEMDPIVDDGHGVTVVSP